MNALHAWAIEFIDAIDNQFRSKNPDGGVCVSQADEKIHWDGAVAILADSHV